MKSLPSIEKGTYRHYKNHHHHEVLGVSLHTETNDALVVYRPLYSSEYELFTRPYENFVETVERRDGVQVRRFIKTDE